MLAFQPGITWQVTDNPKDRVLGMFVSRNYFDVSGIHPRLGTLTFPAHQTDVVVISERLWRRRGSDPGIIGRTLRIHGDVRVIGVVPDTFTGMSLAWQRRTEIGIRVALGAQPRDLLWMVLCHGAALAAVGCAIGIGLSQLSLPIVSAAFYGIRPVELGLLCSVVLFDVLMGLAIAYLVARPWLRLSAMEIVRQR